MRPPQANQYRDSWCGELGSADVGSEVRVAGWVHRRRDHGGLIFIDLRDRSGVLQIVFHPERGAELFTLAEQLRPEHVVSVSGELLARGAENINPEMATGAVELEVSEGGLLASSHTPPFAIDEDGPVDETTRLRYRWLDLRRSGMQQTMITRALITQTLREQLVERDFLEIETPILTKSTPEGSLDYSFNPVSLALGAEATFVARTIDSDRKHLTEVLTAAAAHEGTALIEIYQNCNIFNDGAWEPLKDSDTRDDAMMRLVHGQPIRFGKDM